MPLTFVAVAVVEQQQAPTLLGISYDLPQSLLSPQRAFVGPTVEARVALHLLKLLSLHFHLFEKLVEDGKSVWLSWTIVLLWDQSWRSVQSDAEGGHLLDAGAAQLAVRSQRKVAVGEL